VVRRELMAAGNCAVSNCGLFPNLKVSIRIPSKVGKCFGAGQTGGVHSPMITTHPNFCFVYSIRNSNTGKKNRRVILRIL
jgi:hypothetical protein